MPSIHPPASPSMNLRQAEISGFGANMLSLVRRAGPSQQQSPQVPLGAIIGAAVGGFSLTIVVIVGWILCGRLSKRRRQAKCVGEPEKGEYRKRRNTLKNARRSTDEALLYGSMPRPRFAEKERDDSPTLVGTPRPEGKEVQLPGIAPVNVSKPKPLHTKQQRSEQLRNEDMSMLEAHIPTLSHKQSALSTASSVYSTASGEERALQMPRSMLLAALDEEGDTPHRVSRALSSLPDQRRSMASSRKSFLSRISEGLPNRLSHASSHQSMFTAGSRDSSGAKVGVAL